MPTVKDKVTGDVVSRQPYTAEGTQRAEQIAESDQNWEIDHVPTQDGAARNVTEYAGGGKTGYAQIGQEYHEGGKAPSRHITSKATISQQNKRKRALIKKKQAEALAARPAKKKAKKTARETKRATREEKRETRRAGRKEGRRVKAKAKFRKKYGYDIDVVAKAAGEKTHAEKKEKGGKIVDKRLAAATKTIAKRKLSPKEQRRRDRMKKLIGKRIQKGQAVKAAE